MELAAAKRTEAPGTGTSQTAPACGGRIAQLAETGRCLNGRPALVAQRALADRLSGAAPARGPAGGHGHAPEEAAAKPRAAPAGPRPIVRGDRVEAVRRAAPVTQLGGAGSKADETAVEQAEYARLVSKATGLLLGKIGFGASPEGQFDARYWEKIEDSEYKLSIKATVPASTAIRALVAAPKGVWNFDCAEFVQVCNLYAAMKLWGDESVDAKPLVLRQHGSTPFQGNGVTFERKENGAKFDLVIHRQDNAYASEFADEAALLAHAPAGSRFCFKNPAAPDTPFRNENAVALGGGTFAAHPMGTNLTPDQIVAKLVDYNKRSGLGGDSGGRADIFVSQVEIYGSIPMSKATLEGLGLTDYQKLL